MGLIEFGANLSIGPSAGVATFPASSVIAPIEITKGSLATTGSSQRTVDSASSYVTLSGIGANQNVTSSDFFYLRTDATFQLRLTLVDEAGTSTYQVVLPVRGIFLYEPPSAQKITLAEVKGVGVIEYFASSEN